MTLAYIQPSRSYPISIANAHLGLINSISTASFEELTNAIDELPPFTLMYNDRWSIPQTESNTTLPTALINVTNPHLTDHQRAELIYILFKKHSGYYTLFFNAETVNAMLAQSACHDVLMRIYSEVSANRYITDKYYRLFPKNKKTWDEQEKEIWSLYLEKQMHGVLLAPFLVNEHRQEQLIRILLISKLMLETSTDPVTSYQQLDLLFTPFKHKFDWEKYVFQMAELVLLEKAWRLKSMDNESKPETPPLTNETVKSFLESKDNKGFFSFLFRNRPSSNPLTRLCDKIFSDDEKTPNLLKEAKKNLQKTMNDELSSTFKQEIKLKL